MTALTRDEEVTLRRVAYGQSDLRMLRPQDLHTLRELKLIAEHRDGPLLTPEGRRAFEALHAERSAASTRACRPAVAGDVGRSHQGLEAALDRAGRAVNSFVTIKRGDCLLSGDSCRLSWSRRA